MKLLYGENDHTTFNRALSDIECNPVARRNPVPSPGVALGCTSNLTVIQRAVTIARRRASTSSGSSAITWLRFGIDHEDNDSTTTSSTRGPVASASTSIRPAPARPWPTAASCPAGYNAYVRHAPGLDIRQLQHDRRAPIYLEDNWSDLADVPVERGLAHGCVRQHATPKADSYIKTGQHARAARRLHLGHDR